MAISREVVNKNLISRNLPIQGNLEFRFNRQFLSAKKSLKISEKFDKPGLLRNSNSILAIKETFTDDWIQFHCYSCSRIDKLWPNSAFAVQFRSL